MARKAIPGRRTRRSPNLRVTPTATPPAPREATEPRRARRLEEPFQAFLVSVGRQVARLRTNAGLTQEQAASRARMLLQQWQRLERGKTNATLQTLFEAARVLDVPVSTVVTPLVERVPNVARPGRPTGSSRKPQRG